MLLQTGGLDFQIAGALLVGEQESSDGEPFLFGIKGLPAPFAVGFVSGAFVQNPNRLAFGQVFVTIILRARFGIFRSYISPHIIPGGTGGWDRKGDEIRAIVVLEIAGRQDAERVHDLGLHCVTVFLLQKVFKWRWNGAGKFRLHLLLIIGKEFPGNE